ncbi:LTA synthase family protein [Butyrivibrio sp. WCD3002]|uniref:LTA synthase family protein n=1 Tax=Butyrivibrio sp. WCD3002 TaxID=1280676 RepID=UPI001A9A2A92|nr:LTA synthase family protein [Butyrivibrio sp. WCD3002]
MTILVAFMLGTTNHFVEAFRGDCFKASDILVAGTAAKVADQYNFVLTDGIVRPLILLLWVIVITRFFSFPYIKGAKKRAIMVGAGIVYLVFEYLLFLNVPIFDRFGYEIYPVRPQDSYAEYGATAGFVMTLQDSKIKVPENYSRDEVEGLLATYEDNTDSIEDMPTVIAIMNEAFSDLSVLGDFEAEDYMADWYGISDYTMRGFVYVPVCGGGTANSEFEFLTGLSMAGYNVGVYPYQQYNLKNAYSIGHDLKRIGAETIAFHPYNAFNYNRKNVYKYFDFNNYYSRTDMDPDSPVINWGISDQADYNKLIELYDNSSKPSFVFNVTMQNHGGYTDSLNIDSYVSVGDDYKMYQSMINYLTLVRESSIAYKNLVDHFRNVDEKAVIVMFGDHQPAIYDGSIEALYENDGSIENAAHRYMTPYMIWANYDLGKGQIEKDMSLNYLAANMYELLGIKTDYTGYLLDLQKEFPVIGVFGYEDAAGNWHSYYEQNDRIDEYFRVEYHELTGK